MTEFTDGWNEWAKHVLITQDATVKGLEELRRQNSEEHTKMMLNAVERRETEREYNSKQFADIKICIQALKADMATKKEVGDNKTDITSLKVKAGMWGLVAGAIPGVLIILWWVVENVIIP